MKRDELQELEERIDWWKRQAELELEAFKAERNTRISLQARYGHLEDRLEAMTRNVVAVHGAWERCRHVMQLLSDVRFEAYSVSRYEPELYTDRLAQTMKILKDYIYTSLRAEVDPDLYTIERMFEDVRDEITE